MADMHFKHACQLVSHHYKFTGTVPERAFAQIRQAVHGEMKIAEVECVSSIGLLSHMRSAHLKLGRPNPCYVTRSEVLTDGVPLNARRPAQGKILQVGGMFINFKAKCVEERRRQVGLS